MSPLGKICLWGRREADFLKPLDIEAKLEALKPDIIVNAAAWTKVDLAESQPIAANIVNNLIPSLLATWSAKNSSLLIHYSTDYVFDGSKESAYSETDRPNPLNIYGQTKLDGDLAILNNTKKVYIFRTSWVFSLIGQNFPKTILKLASEKPELTINNDQIGSPTSAEFLAAVTAVVIRDYLSNLPQQYGLYNLTSNGETSWLGYAQYLLAKARELGFTFFSDQTTLIPSYGPNPQRPAKRPLNSRLDPTKIESQLKITRPTWQEEIDKLLRAMALLGLK
jgi:dTDP-4-dehydrorhamnose reductase